jgi:hypothetical protein
MDDDFGHLGMRGGMPVGNVEEVVDLGKGEGEFAAGNVELRGFVGHGREVRRRSGGIDGEGPVGRRVKGLARDCGLLRLAGGSGSKKKRGSRYGCATEEEPEAAGREF